MKEVIAKCGHDGGEIYTFADKEEAWLVEVYTGHQWAAVKLPPDKVSVFGNQFMIGSFDPASPDVRMSKDLLKLPESKGKLVCGKDGLPDLYATYSGPLTDYANYRTWFAHEALAAEPLGTYRTSLRVPLFFAPKGKVSLKDLFALSRTRYEGTDWNPEANNRPEVRTIGTTKQMTCHVIQLDPKLPPAFAGTVWVALGNAEHVPYLPINASAGALDTAFEMDQTGAYRFDVNLAGHAFRRLAALAEQDRKWYGQGVRDFWTAREARLLFEYPRLLASSAKGVDLGKEVGTLTAWTVREQHRAYEDAKRIFDELMWYVMANNRISGDGSGATDTPERPFVPAVSPSFSRYRFVDDAEAPLLYYDAYQPTEAGSAAEVAVVLIHGWGGHVRTLLPVFVQALKKRVNNAMPLPYVIAPQFPRRETIRQNGEPDDGRAVWCDSWAGEKLRPDKLGSAADDWRGGGDADGTTFSSFDYVDRIFARLADRALYPHLKRVVLAGFSAGGQFVGRYAAVGKGVVREGVTVAYVAMSASTYLRIDPEALWHYGLKGRPRYSAALTVDEMLANLSARRVWYGCGSEDVLGRPHTSLDMTAPAVAQGKNRFVRFRRFQKSLEAYPEWLRQSSFHVFKGVGHKEDLCYPDPILLDFILDEPVRCGRDQN